MGFTPSRLTAARLRRGLTRKALAQVAKISERTLHRYEMGAEPLPETLESLAKALRFPVAFFWRPDLDAAPVVGASFRALSRITARERDAALAGGALAFDLNEWIETRFQLPKVDVPELRPETDPEAAALAVRTQWALGDGPISNMVHLLEVKGVRVYSLAEDCETVDAFSLWRGDVPFVFLNTLKSAEHGRFDAAHELGHLVMHRHGMPSGQQAEHEANRFASAFLLPRTGLYASVAKNPTLDYLVEAKLPWRVSVAALAYRLREIGMLSEWYYKTLSIEIQRRHYRRHEPEPQTRELSQVLAKVFEMLRDEGIKRQDVAAHLAWPVDELNALIFQLVLSNLPPRRREDEEPEAEQPVKKPNLTLYTNPSPTDDEFDEDDDRPIRRTGDGRKPR